jgi:hypothetical protein
MKNITLSIILAVLLPASVLIAQQKPLYKDEQIARQKALSKELTEKYTENYNKALALARKNGWVIYEKSKNGRVLVLAGVTETNQPIYHISDNNTIAASTTRTDALYTGGSLGLNLNGGSTKMNGRLAYWEAAGGPLKTHQEFGSRITQMDSPSNTAEEHATHVAGTLIAAGTNPVARGMAWGATLKAWDATSDVSEITAAVAGNGGILLSNHSYGDIAGWYYNGDRAGTTQWEWWGDDNISTTEDYKFGFYNSKASDLDKISYNAPNYLFVKSAGNFRNSSGPTAGTAYYLQRTNTTSTITRNSNGIFGNISTYGTAKNILSVGAVYSIPTGYNVPTDVELSDFSSTGPTDDGRIKPDLVAVGVNVTSTSNASNTSYESLSGTSMSSPNVTGSLFLLQEHYANLKSGAFMRSATLKGVAIHTAEEAGPGPGPDYTFGWGLLNTAKAAQVISNSGNNHLLEERNLAQGETYSFQVIASGNGPLKGTISWTDPEATAFAATAANLNNRTPKLINDLDIRISDGSTDYLPWVLDFNNPANAATTGDNIRDNVEQVLIAEPVPGKTYTVTVKHKGNLKNSSQPYSLIMSGIGGKTYCASAPSATGTVRIANFSFGTINNTSPNNCTTYSDYTNVAGTIYVIKQAQNLSVQVANCNGNIDKIVKVFIDYNSDGDFEDTGELLATSGVINGESTFSTPIVFPDNVTYGNTLRMRAIVVATNSASSVTSCGNYPNGETEDYKIVVARPKIDIEMAELVAPATSVCATPTQNVVVRLRNNGLDTLSGFSVNVVVKDGATIIKNFQTTYKFKLPPVSQDDYDLSSFFSTETGKTYTFEMSVTATGDQDNTNNTLNISRTISSPTTLPSGLSALICGNDAFLSSTSPSTDGTIFWYDAASNGNLLGIGNQVTTLTKPSNNTYYAALNDFRASFGAKDKYVYSGGSYAGNFGPQPLISTKVPLVIESARLYIGNSGLIRFLVVPMDESELISDVILDVTATRATQSPNIIESGSQAGQLTDDPNDQGAVYALNLKIPKPGDYKILIQYGNGASIYRSNNGVANFPFEIPGVIKMKGSLFQRSATQTDTLTTAYYYLYNMQVKALDCAGPRASVVATTNPDPAPSATLTGGGVFCSSENYALNIALTGTPPWNLTYTDGTNSVTVNNITTSPYTVKPDKSGSYKVTALSDSKSCKTFKTSGVANFTITTSQKATITVTNGFTLTASKGSAYTWYLNGKALSYITQQIVATAIGKYSVEVVGDNPNCPVSRSDEVNITVAAAEPELEEGLEISPNPSTGQFNLKINTAFPVIKGIQVKNVLGQTIKTIAISKNNPSEMLIDLTGTSSGIYFLSVETSNKTVTKRLIKQ